ncbi:MAG: apolipoprotein N-acyltransferase [Nitriliruptor sp.]|nr:MAG: apolipoprotein N-acyltransferase [Nitriliruptor sp.]
MIARRGLSAGAPAVAAASGLVLLAAHPPVGWWWLTFAHPPLLIAALWLAATADEGPGRWRPFGLGAVAGLVAFGPMLSWLIAPAGYVGWGLLVGVQAVWMGLLALLLSRFLDHRLLPVIAAIGWTAIDAWRAIFPLNGFEWGAIAYAHVDASWMLPMARVVGGRGITLIVALVGVAAAVAARQTVRQIRGRGDRSIEDALTGTTLPLGLMVGGLLVSILITIEAPPTEGTLDVLVVQGNDIRHWEDPVPDPPTTITTNLRDETLAAIGDGPPPDLTVWPESSIDRDLTTERGANLRSLVDEAAGVAGEMVAGATMDGPDPAANRFIAALQFDGDAQEVDRYVKRRLVPFGEYIPARELLDWFPPLEQVPRDAISGSGPQQLSTAQQVRLAVIICFETLFTDIWRTNILTGDDPAQLVLSLTNDASFRDSAEPAQHLAQVQLRAVETGRWVVHASIAGGSAFVDPAGNAHDVTPLFAVDSIRRDLPLAAGQTPYLATGDILGWTARIAVLGLAALAWIGGRRPDETSDAAGSGPPG